MKKIVLVFCALCMLNMSFFAQADDNLFLDDNLFGIDSMFGDDSMFDDDLFGDDMFGETITVDSLTADLLGIVLYCPGWMVCAICGKLLTLSRRKTGLPSTWCCSH